ncbi:MAG: alpha/beta fold hydrolase [Chloroflexi bacterium]|nr:MAG: alpha/beta fold hydrolase [Chloroflexota bacterium]
MNFLKLGVAVVVVAAAVVGGLFYQVYYAGPAAALQRAEAFGFRRMTVSRLTDTGTYRFHYVTNRVEGSVQGPIDSRFGRDRESSLKFGFFDTHIEQSLGIGMLIDPTEWFQNEEIQIDAVTTLDRQVFVAQLRQLVERSPYRSLLVLVHGFREAFPSALRKTAFIGHVLDINSPVLLFDWPGDQGASLRGYRRAREVAEASGAELAETLELVIRKIQPDRLWLIANSMGAQVVTAAFSILYAADDLADAETEIEDVILTAPDVDKSAFDQRFKREITALADHLTVYVSSNDKALLVSRIINRGKRLGESTVSPDQLAEALSLAELIDPGSERITLVDVTPINRTRNFHNFSLETPEFFDDLFLRLSNEVDPRSRLIYRVKTAEGKEYQVLTQGR